MVLKSGRGPESGGALLGAQFQIVVGVKARMQSQRKKRLENEQKRKCRPMFQEARAD